MSATHPVNRRQFLKVSGSLAIGALLAACNNSANQTPGNTPANTGTLTSATVRAPGPLITTTLVPQSATPLPISFMCRADIVSAYAADKAVAAWNKDNVSQVTLANPPQGDVAAQLQAGMAAGVIAWDGYAVLEAPWNTESWVKRGLIVPLDDYIAASTVPDAPLVVPAIIPSILESAKYRGQLYVVPGNVDSVALAWLTDPLKAAGYSAPPETWDELRYFAIASKKATPKLTPFDSADWSLTTLLPMIWGSTDQPFDTNGLIDIMGQPSIDALTWCQEMVKEGLTPKTKGDSFTNWLKGGTAMISCFDVAGTMAQQTFGATAADTGINFFKMKGNRCSGTPFWINGSVVLNQSKNPQGMVDFYMYWMGPSNKTTGMQIASAAAKPCYQYTYDDFIKPDPANAWQQAGIDIVRHSKWFPANSAFTIENTKLGPWIEKVVDPTNPMDPKQAMASALKDIQTELAKQTP